MASSSAVLKRMDKRVAELLADFAGFVRVFGASERFTGPSWYFHRKALSRRAEHHTVASLLDDDLFFDALYATLAAWGLHRMGPGKTKLRDLGDIRTSLRAQATLLDELRTVRISTVGEAERSRVVNQVWSVLSGLKVSVAKAQLVANTKALHHVLPALVPPIDRAYTFQFFYGRTMLSIDERTAFTEMFSRLLRVAAAQSSVIPGLIGGPWNTSESKVVDNAVVGYVIARENQAGVRS